MSPTREQIEFFRTNGYSFPYPALLPEEAKALRTKLEAYERATGDDINRRLKIKAHLAFPWMCELARHPAILDVVSGLIGPDLLLFGSSAFVKNAQDPRFVSWHQDSAYYGLDPHQEVTVWLALSRATSESGCLQVLPGSHLGPDLTHDETYDANNLLSRGQTLRGIDESRAVEMPLEPGWFSVHHERTAHGSGPNRSDDRRIGVAFFYMPTHTRSTLGRRSAMPVAGADTYGHWDLDLEPRFDLDPISMAKLDAVWAEYRNGAVTPQAVTIGADGGGRATEEIREA